MSVFEPFQVSEVVEEIDGKKFKFVPLMCEDGLESYFKLLSDKREERLGAMKVEFKKWLKLNDPECDPEKVMKSLSSKFMLKWWVVWRKLNGTDEE